MSRAVSVTSAVSNSSSGRRESGKSRGIKGMSREVSVAPSMASVASGASISVKRERGDDGESVLSVVQSVAESENNADTDESRTEAGESDGERGGDDTIIARSPSDGGWKRERTADTGTDVFTDAEG
ncbi:hypothetical protein EMCG_04181 [[Emmonsia] crescens]|uniref:Uncharacterized protein n=1 Tax=[Emmonsia] crescens TaxID=73230 RepID=A0A0G2J7T4_9EURO|nr:hypothetical protein EMCG_04181 [Emmonsia crescens UAMH 3008]